VDVEKFIALPDAELNVTVLLPRLIVRLLVLKDKKLATETLWLLVVKAPFVKVMLLDEVSGSPRDQPPPTPLNTIATGSETPAVVIVLPLVVELNVIVPLAVHVVVPDKEKDPETAIVPVLVNVIVVPVLLKSLQVKAPVSVTV
jgi:hypothetical protein